MSELEKNNPDFEDWKKEKIKKEHTNLIFNAWVGLGNSLFLTAFWGMVIFYISIPQIPLFIKIIFWCFFGFFLVVDYKKSKTLVDEYRDYRSYKEWVK